MKVTKLLILISLSLISCVKNRPQKIIILSHYKDDQKLIDKNFLKITSVKTGNYDSLTVFKDQEIILTFNEQVSPIGIYRYLGNHKTLTYSFIDTMEHKSPKSYHPLFNLLTVFKKSKSYKIGSHYYKLSLFNEHSSIHEGIDSYYLQNVGFICYYDFTSNQIFLCDSLNNYDINSKDLKQLTTQLLKDSSFFTKYYYDKADRILKELHQHQVLNH